MKPTVRSIGIVLAFVPFLATVSWAVTFSSADDFRKRSHRSSVLPNIPSQEPSSNHSIQRKQNRVVPRVLGARARLLIFDRNDRDQNPSDSVYVPEPTTLFLMGSGFVGILLVARKFRRL